MKQIMDFLEIPFDKIILKTEYYTRTNYIDFNKIDKNRNLKRLQNIDSETIYYFANQLARYLDIFGYNEIDIEKTKNNFLTYNKNNIRYKMSRYKYLLQRIIG